ncbi:hypothetical protein BU26DRAFT_563662 [Trematosphaeria pertusa]|uniref:F-box domain-containing protein n=1 Tax=Trematosphaeria pertusa TaxID=390896 RepID=A0A6A6IHU4_9PLEO|nr:uncharacterized protein BU26DRAFT_563662 [Trematosphaeria pertusa]KAF2249769.1 hypothetical protein BU26DRAFT_563662 [Trematosphaeria pertusa]
MRELAAMPPCSESAMMSTQAKNSKAFPFLELPAEVRNRIYEFAVENNRVRIAKRPGKGCTPIFLNFTKVCRLIRTEYRPLYLRRTHALVTLADVDSYVSVFVLSGGIESKDAIGNIVIYAPPSE